MKTPEEILKEKAPGFILFQGFDSAVIEAMKEYAEQKSREMVLEYARWYEENSVPEESQNEDWMIQENVKSFYDARL